MSIQVIRTDDTRVERYALTVDGNLAGQMELDGGAGTDARIVDLLVEAPFRRRGIGRHALHFAQELLRAREIHTLRAHVDEQNRVARAFLEASGYAQSERIERGEAVVCTYFRRLSDDWECVRAHWGASIYDQQENYQEDVQFMLKLLPEAPQRILEVCTGGGRILAPLARAGHQVVGMDMDEEMLSHINAKARGLNNLQYYRADALGEAWGEGFDVVVLAGNILINIETPGDYRAAQCAFIERAAQALKPGGLLYLDFDLHAHPEAVFSSNETRVVFDGRDDRGVYGRYMGLGGWYEASTQMADGRVRTELTLPDGRSHALEKSRRKHIPTLADVHGWLSECGFSLYRQFGGWDGCALSESTHRAVILAKRKDR